MQDRLGPNRANIGPIRLWGILHFVADAHQDDRQGGLRPGQGPQRAVLSRAHSRPRAGLHRILDHPFGPTIYPNELGWHRHRCPPVAIEIRRDQPAGLRQVDFGLLFYFAILTVANYGADHRGLGQLQQVGLARRPARLVADDELRGLDGPVAHGRVPRHGHPRARRTWSPGRLPTRAFWGVVVQPLAFLLFFVAAIAETKRAPFDLPEGEPEIIGYFVEYSGIRWGMFFLAEFIEIVFIAAVITTVFFGGYHVPFLYEDGFHIAGYSLPMVHWAVVLLQFAAFGAKVVFFCFLQLAIRWTLPRFRPDQLMQIGWKILLPLALLNIMVTALITLFM